MQLFSVPPIGPAAAASAAELPVSVQLFSVLSYCRPAAELRRVAGQRAIVERARKRPASAIGGRVAGQRAVVQRAQTRPAAVACSRVAGQRAVVERAVSAPPPSSAELHASMQLFSVPRIGPAATVSRVVRQRAVVQRAAICPAAMTSQRRVAHQHTVGSTPLSDSHHSPPPVSGDSVGQGEPGQAGAVGQIHAANRAAARRSP